MFRPFLLTGSLRWCDATGPGIVPLLRAVGHCAWCGLMRLDAYGAARATVIVPSGKRLTSKGFGGFLWATTFSPGQDQVCRTDARTVFETQDGGNQQLCSRLEILEQAGLVSSAG